MSRLHIEFAMETLEGGYTFYGKNLVRFDTLVYGDRTEDSTVFEDSSGLSGNKGGTGFRIALTTGSQYEPLFHLPLFYRLTAVRVRWFEKDSAVLNKLGELGDLQVLLPVYWGLHAEGGMAVRGVTAWFDSDWPMTLGLAQQWSGKSIDGKNRHSPDLLSDGDASDYHMIHAGTTAHDSVTSRADEVLCRPHIFPGDDKKTFYNDELTEFASCRNRFRPPSDMEVGPEIATFFRDFYFGVFGRFREDIFYDAAYVTDLSGTRRRVDVQLAAELRKADEALAPFVAFSGNFIIDETQDPLSFVPQEGSLFSFMIGLRFFLYPDSEKGKGDE